MKKNVFLEIGSCRSVRFWPFLYPDWKDRIRNGNSSVKSHIFDELLDIDGGWEGWFVEPIPSHLDYLTKQGYAELPNAHFVQGAVHGDSQLCEFGIYTDDSWEDPTPMGSFIFYKDEVADRVIHQTLILKPFTLDELLDYVSITPNLIKMNVEGSERPVLETYSWSRLPDFWQINIHNDLNNQHFAVELFEKQGYVVVGTELGESKKELWAKKRGAATGKEKIRVADFGSVL